MNDQELIAGILAGNKHLYRQLVEKYKEMVFRISVGFVHNKADADDISQEVFINAFQSLSSFLGKSEFSTWLYRITVNTSLNFLRKKHRRRIIWQLESLVGQDRKSAVTLISENEDSADQKLIEKQHIKKVQEAVSSLPEKQRIAFILSKYDDLPQQEIAKVMETSVGAVEQLLQRAKGNLKKQLADYYKNNFLNP